MGVWGGCAIDAVPVPAATGPPSMVDGAVDWMVVSVVVKERSEWLGDENVLLPAPSFELKPPTAVLLVPAFDCPASELMVPALVATVGAADLLLATGGLRSSPAPSSTAKLFRALDVGVIESCPLALLAIDCR